MNYEEMVESLNKDYLMVRKGRWLFFLGGAAAFVIAAGFVSYQAALAAVGSSAATQAVTAIETLLVGAREDRDKIGTLLADSRADAKEKKMNALREAMLTLQQSLADLKNIVDNLANRQDFSERTGGELATRMTEVRKQLEIAKSSMALLEANTQNITTSVNGCETIISVGDERKAVFQCDGNLVIYRVSDNKALWASNTWVKS